MLLLTLHVPSCLMVAWAHGKGEGGLGPDSTGIDVAHCARVLGSRPGMGVRGGLPRDVLRRGGSPRWGRGSSTISVTTCLAHGFRPASRYCGVAKRKTPLGGAGFLIETAEGRGDLGRSSTRLLSACLVAGGLG
jgi:hypothetical protein